MRGSPDAGAEADAARFAGFSSGAARWGGTAFAAWAAGVVVLLLATAMTTAVGYDEDQYIAAGVLARHLRPYADFVYLQPPLYPLVLSLLFEATGGYYLLAGRALTWALSVASSVLLLGVLLRLGAGRLLAALLVTAFVASPFLHGPIANTRNDILPLCLFLGGLALCLRADEDRGAVAPSTRALLAASGLCFGFAVTAKLSYAFGPPVVLLHALLARGRTSARAAGAARSRLPPLAAGLAVAASPGLYYLCVAPEGFLYGQLEYHLTAPVAWYAQEGQAGRLHARDRAILLGELLVFGGNGTLVVLASLAAVARWTRREQADGASAPATPFPAEGLILGLLAGALLCGFLPRPSWPQYYAPVAPLLACWIAAGWRHVRAAAPRRRPLLAVTALASLPTVLSLGPHGDALAKLPALGEWAGLAVHRNAVAIRDAVRAAGGDGHVATLFPTHVLDANPVRAEFASGAFFFRTAGLLPPDRIARLRGTGPEDLERLFAADPPAAIFGGIHPGRWRAPMDAALVAYAERHGYALVMQDSAFSGAVGGRLYVRPAGAASAR